jgi:hypothetical protein
MEVYTGENKTIVTILENLHEKLKNEEGLSDEEIEKDWLGMRRRGSSDSLAVSPKAIEWMEERKILVKPAKDLKDWKTGGILYKIYGGVYKNITTMLEDLPKRLKEEKRLSDKEIEKDWVGIRRNKTQDAPAVSPKAIAWLEKKGILKPREEIKIDEVTQEKIPSPRAFKFDHGPTALHPKSKKKGGPSK